MRQVTEHDYAPAKTPRYYQLNAINRTVEAVARGQNRALLVMATGTGKTYTAFQIIWRLWKSGAKKRILFLADRNILIDQTMVNDFRPFKGAMAKLSPHAKGVEVVDSQGKTTVEDVDLAINRTTKQVNKSYEIYLSLYQAVSGTEEERNIYKQFSPDFFDLIIIDECHRGSAAEDSAWRDILSYFSTATQIGLTATPKETADVSNTDYFGEPVYTYSLRQGIEDGYLAPYKVTFTVEAGLNIIGALPSFPEDRFLAWIHSALSVQRQLTLVAAEHLGVLMASRRWERAAKELADRYGKSRLDLLPALRACADFLGFFKCWTLGITRPSAAEKWSALEEEACELYQDGPDTNELWSRAGGKNSALPGKSSNGSARWHTALMSIRQGGKPTAYELLGVMASDFPGNERIRLYANDSDIVGWRRR